MAENSRPLVLVSGYYGFGNLGDEAILEELTNELKKLVLSEHIIVLSNDPENTKRTFGVQSISRWQPMGLVALLRRTSLFISGGGGLFQDATGIKSTIFYGSQILLARIMGSQALVYAQGVGPLSSSVSRRYARLALSQATDATVRDSDSFRLLSEWQITPTLTADPVWCLEKTEMPPGASAQISRLKNHGSAIFGLSLRQSSSFTDEHRQDLVTVLAAALPEDAQLLLLPLQANQDMKHLTSAQEQWQKLGRKGEMLDTSGFERPSQWMSILCQLDMLVGMRLHALIMALKSGVPVIGIDYDPKVRYVVTQFGQPILNLTKENDTASSELLWLPTVKTAVANRHELSIAAKGHAEAAKKLACHNFEVLARILEHAK